MSFLSKLKSNKAIAANMLTEFISSDERGFIPTGCIALNILFSGRVDGGLPIGRISQLASISSSGKSFLGMKLAKNAQKLGMDVVLIDTEFAYSREFADKVGIDPDRIMVIQDNHIESIQQALMQIREDLTKEEQAKLFIVLDSWNSMTSSKTNEDALSGKDTTDMTTAKKKNTLAKLLQGFGTCFIVNQLYANVMDQYNPFSIGGGGGLYYAASSIVMGTSKSKDKESDGEISGTFVLCQTKKSRFAVENSKLKYLIKYDGGIHPVYGILDDAIAGGFVVKPSNGWYTRSAVVDDKKWREKEVWDNWKEFWSPILNDAKFKEYIETVYSFKHNEIVDGDFNAPDEDDFGMPN